MQDPLYEKLLQELRGQTNGLMAALQLLTALIREHGSEQDRHCFSLMTQLLYRQLRLIRHMEVCNEDLPFSPKDVDVAKLCRNLGRALEPVAKDLGISFWWELGKGNAFSHADPYLLDLALLNLLSNAFRVSGKGGRVVLRLSVNHGNFLLSVEDSGPGLCPPAPSEDPFLKQEDGIGLGVHTVEKVAALHGGALMRRELDSGGLVSTLTLPLRPPKNLGSLKGPMLIYGANDCPDRDGLDWFEGPDGFNILLMEFSPFLPNQYFQLKYLE